MILVMTNHPYLRVGHHSHEQCLLRLGAAEKTELSLSRVKLAVDLQRICGLSEHRWVCR
jgi:hypothetical protein